ncbi:protein E6-like [Diospyros lotus]|uniref:protein E6-like n=1 Tax=Diospyros lotus TaxID=55363 RepID=UPI00225A39E6|nr:protein E6-like [Diospyros lotus]
MASSAKSLPLLFLLLALLSSQISHARDSQFFSKIPAATTNPTAKESVVEVNPNRQQEPTFIPADTQNSYGHESGQLSPTTTSAAATTTTTSEPYTAANDLPFETQFQEPYSYYNKHAYVTKPQGYVPTTHFFNTHPQNGGYTARTTASYNNYYNSQLGMSDTRFLENGKYYYDPKSEYSNKGYYGNPENSYEDRKWGMGGSSNGPFSQGGFEP